MGYGVALCGPDGPLGIPHTYAPGTVRQVIDFYKGSNMLLGSKNRVAGLALSAIDHGWQHGEGEPVEAGCCRCSSP